jgi:hypothetical protein
VAQPAGDEQAISEENIQIGPYSPQELREKFPHLIPAYNNMLRDYHKKSEANARDRDQLQAEMREVEQLRAKADMFDQIRENPHLMNQAQAQPFQPTPAQGQFQTRPPTAEYGYAEGEGADPSQGGAWAHWANQLRQQIASDVQQNVQQQFMPVFGDLYKREQDREQARLSATYPDFDQHMPTLHAMRKRDPSLTWEAAYKVHTWDTQRDLGRQDALKAMTVKREMAEMANANFPMPTVAHAPLPPHAQVPPVGALLPQAQQFAPPQGQNYGQAIPPPTPDQTGAALSKSLDDVWKHFGLPPDF